MIRKYRKSSSYRLFLCLSIILAISLSILIAVSYILEQVDFEYESKAAINAKISSIEAIYSESGITQVKNILKKYDSHDYNYFYYLLDKNNRKTYGNLNKLPANVTIQEQAFVMFALETDTIVEGETGNKHHQKGSAIMAKIIHFPDGSNLLLGRNIEHIEIIRKTVHKFIWIIGALLSLIAIISFYVSTYVVRKLNIIGKTTETIRETGDLSRRIELTTNWDDLSNLAVLLNAMLADIENLLADVKHVSDNISHDLRIPLTRFRNQLENLQYEQIKNSAEEFALYKNNLITEADKLLNIFHALLKISYLETGKSKLSLVSANIAELLQDAIEFYQPISENKNINITAKLADIAILVDRDLFFQALINLIDNAIKYTPKNGKINILSYQKNSKTIIEISDTGAGISKAEKQNVFKRFYRIDKSRNTTGSGLGLSLVFAVIKAHHGTIELLDNNPGLKIRITI